ncbi:MAG: hypothetical protein P857_118 [Candidatus Xenolissoclinum pacificiensis L6]|uniref:Uncharacterized protein n=1 Tax=Candidatus Xenolissoclinum pacificiensis L6 TaxID=1401685 RepID=W2V0Q4_9RICK|nr:MAG: hypothetical protein P857_118 [Candidatus Xenolissoclinum pacificiensis L6]
MTKYHHLEDRAWQFIEQQKRKAYKNPEKIRLFIEGGIFHIERRISVEILLPEVYGR